MANQNTPKLFRSLRQIPTRHVSSTPSSIPILPLNYQFLEKPSQTDTILDFNDTKTLFSTFSNTKLIRSSVNLNMAAVDAIVDVGMYVMRSKMMAIPGFREVILGAVKNSFYEQFVAGKDMIETSENVRKIYRAGLKGMLNYGLEHAYDNENCDMNYRTFLNTVDSTKFFPPSSVYVCGLIEQNGPNILEART